MIAIGLTIGLAVVLGTIAYLIYRKKNEKSRNFQNWERKGRGKFKIALEENKIFLFFFSSI